MLFISVLIINLFPIFGTLAYSIEVNYINSTEYVFDRTCINPQFARFQNSLRVKDGYDLKSITDEMRWLALVLRPITVSGNRNDPGRVETCFGTYYRKCTGFLVQPSFVITAAHCVLKYYKEQMPEKCKTKSDWIVRLGISPQNRNFSSGNYLDIPVDHIFYMKSHVVNTSIDDIAVLHPARYRAFHTSNCGKVASLATPAYLCLTSERVRYEPPRNLYWSIGWGDITSKPYAKVSDFPQVSIGLMLNVSKCPFTRTICTDTAMKHLEGDSGGPTFIRYSNRYQLSGVVSRGSNLTDVGVAVHSDLTDPSVLGCLKDFFAAWPGLYGVWKCQLQYERWKKRFCEFARLQIYMPPIRECSTNARKCERWQLRNLGPWKDRPYVNIQNVQPQKFCMVSRSTFDCN